jgi:hypothetical protein
MLQYTAALINAAPQITVGHPDRTVTYLSLQLCPQTLAMEVERIDFSTLPPPPPPPSLGLRRESARAVARDGPELLQQQRRRSRSRSKHAGQYPAPPPPPPPPMRGSLSLLKRVGSTDSLPSSSLLHQAQQARQPAAVEDRQSHLAAEVV